MKKSLFLIPFIALVMMLTLTQCKKNYNCGMRVICYFSETGLDTGEVVPFADLEVYPNIVGAGKPIHPAIEDNRYAITDVTGTYEHTYPYEALLNVSATYMDPDDNIEYVGNVQIKLQEGQVVEKVILMTPNY